uniref:Ig-like domain-containing protein n=2 Tax=Dendroctonus ponderosae TaxID=77166 RepID=A0AAR5QG98_DENPD
MDVTRFGSTNTPTKSAKRGLKSFFRCFFFNQKSRTLIEYFLKGVDIPIYIWYESYPTHSAEGYEGRVGRVPAGSNYGAASLNLTDIRESDQGWYECKVVFLNRSPKPPKNGTWFHLDVHAPPRFAVTPDDIIYVNLGDAIILTCQAVGTPTPEILWYKEANPVDPTATVGNI